MSQLMGYVFYGFFIVVELVNCWRDKSIKKLFTGRILWFWFAVCFTFVNSFSSKVILSSMNSIIVRVILDILATFTLAVYGVSRGIPLVYIISGKGDQNPTCLTIKRMLERPLLFYLFVAFLTLLSNAVEIYGILAW